ncbi:MAG: hypothetical protein N5827_03315, partial [Lactobacillus iners]|nr:hypothetical protein [Lactobacillus iners]
FKTKREASIWANKFLADANAGVVAANKAPAFYEYFLRWAKIYRYPHITDITINRYAVTASHIKN